MTKKEELDYNINHKPLIKGIGTGMGAYAILNSIPWVVANPHALQIATVLLTSGLTYEFLMKMLDQIKINKSLIEKNKLKDIKDISAWSFNSGLFGTASATSLLSMINNPTNYIELFVLLLSAGFFVPTYIHLKKDIQTNKNIIQKTR